MGCLGTDSLQWSFPPQFGFFSVGPPCSYQRIQNKTKDQSGDAAQHSVLTVFPKKAWGNFKQACHQEIQKNSYPYCPQIHQCQSAMNTPLGHLSVYVLLTTVYLSCMQCHIYQPPLLLNSPEAREMQSLAPLICEILTAICQPIQHPDTSILSAFDYTVPQLQIIWFPLQDISEP